MTFTISRDLIRRAALLECGITVTVRGPTRITARIDERSKGK